MKEKILVVDGSSQRRCLIVEGLRYMGYEVFEESDGDSGLDSFLKNKPNLIITNVMLPKKDGFTLISIIRGSQAGQCVPIISIIPDGCDNETISRSYKSGTTDFIIGEFHWLVFKRKVEHLLNYGRAELQISEEKLIKNLIYNNSKFVQFEWNVSTGIVVNSVSDVVLRESNDVKDFFSFLDLPLVDELIDEVIQSDFDEATNKRISCENLLEDVVLNYEKVITENGAFVYGSVQKVDRVNMISNDAGVEGNFLDLGVYYKKVSDLTVNFEEKDIGSLFTLVFDITALKKINEMYGHESGDKVINVFSDKINSFFTNDVFISKVGGDEFIVTGYFKDVSKINRWVENISSMFCFSSEIDGFKVDIHSVVGCSLLNSKFDSDGRIMIKDAIRTKNYAKVQGVKHLITTDELSRDLNRVAIIESKMKTGVEDGVFQLHYQPQYREGADGDISLYGAEALIRWIDEDLGFISPAEFIPIAEKTGSIVDIGNFVLKQAINKIYEIQQAGYKDFKMGINLSGKQFSDSDLVFEINNIIKGKKIILSNIDLEITESMAMADADQTILTLKALKAMGMSISIDDFGTGHSSLAYIHKFPIDTLKIDKSFIDNIYTDDGKKIIKTIISLCDSLGLDIISEGVEEEIQSKLLFEMGANIYQGYFFSRPLKESDLDELLKL